MSFDHQKEQALKKLLVQDKSKKGSVDERVALLCQLINMHPDFYTTSSCSGRIVLQALDSSGRKDKAQWLLSSHEEVDFEQVSSALTQGKEVWFRFEPLILHVRARNLEAAQWLLRIARDLGMKRSGIIGIEPRITLELMTSDKIDAPISSLEKSYVTDDYLSYVIALANKKMRRNFLKIAALEEAFRKR